MAYGNRIDIAPYDIAIGGRGFMLAEQVSPTGAPTGQLMFHAERMHFAPGSASPAATPYTVEPTLEIPQVFTLWRNGIGIREQPPNADKDANGIYYGRFIDKCGIYLGPSAAVTTVTPATTDTVNGGNEFIEVPISGPSTPSAPTVGNTGTGGTVAAGTYGIKVTYVNGAGETIASSASTTTTSGSTSHITVTSPGATFGAIGYYVYCTQAGGSIYTRQQSVGQPTSLTANYSITTPPTSTGAVAPTEASPASVLCCAMGRYVLYLSDVGYVSGAQTNTWSNMSGLSLGVGSIITGLAVFRGQQSSTYLNIAFKDSSNVAQNYYTWNGSDPTSALNFTQMSSAAVDFVPYRQSLWMLSQDSNARWQVQQDVTGGASAVWGGAFVVTDGGTTCDKLAISQDRLFIRSARALFGVNGTENDAQQITGDTFTYQNSALTTQCNPIAFGQFLLTSIANTFFAYDAQSGSVSEIGIGVLQNNDSGIATGFHTTAAAYKMGTVYTWTWNPNNNKAYLWRWGDHELIDTLYSPVPYQEELPVLYGSLYEQSTQVNGSAVSTIGGLTPRLYWVDATGNISFMPLSRFATNPYSDPAVPAQTANSSEIYLPGITARAPAEVKVATGMVVAGKWFTSANYWAATYRTDPSLTYGGAADLDNNGLFTSPPAQRNNWGADNVQPPTTQWLDTKLALTNTSSSQPPLIESVAVYTVLRPVFKWTYQFTVKLGSRVHTNSGSFRGVISDVIDDRTFLETLAGTYPPVTLITPDGNDVQAFVTNVTMDYQRRDPKEKPEWYATIEMAEHRPAPVYLAGSYAHLNPLQYSVMNPYPYATLQGI